MTTNRHSERGGGTDDVSEVDAVVLGLGPGGEDAAGRLAGAGLEVVAIEGRLVGGECPYWGCVPTKMMVRAADLLAEGRRIPGMAGRSEVTADWSPVAARIRHEATDDWDDRVAAERLEAKGVRLVRGWGRLDGRHDGVPAGGRDPGRLRVRVGEAVFVAPRVVIDTGTQPWVPPVPGLATTPWWTNHQAVEAAEVPESLVVIGGGAIGLELGQVFARFGAEVTVLETAERLLASEEPEASQLVADVLAREEVAALTGVTLHHVEHDGRQFTVEVEGASRRRITSQRLLVATGRRADLAAIGVSSIGLDETARAIEVDARMRAAPGVWAIGDVTGVGAFTHVSMYQARLAVADMMRPGEAAETADYRGLPRVTFTDPEIGAVGLTEAAARRAGLEVRTGTASLPDSSRGWIHRAGNDGFIKLVEDAGRGVLVGATSAGPCGGEVLGLLVLAVHGQVPTSTLRSMIFAYPTFHRAVETALDDLAS